MTISLVPGASCRADPWHLLQKRQFCLGVWAVKQEAPLSFPANFFLVLRLRVQPTSRTVVVFSLLFGCSPRYPRVWSKHTGHIRPGSVMTNHQTQRRVQACHRLAAAWCGSQSACPLREYCQLGVRGLQADTSCSSLRSYPPAASLLPFCGRIPLPGCCGSLFRRAQESRAWAF